MALSEQTAARLVGFDELGAQMQISREAEKDRL